MYQVIHIGRLFVGRYRRNIDRVRRFVREEKLKASSEYNLYWYGGSHGARPRGGEIHAFVQTDKDNSEAFGKA